MPELFREARLKIERAKEHANDLNRIVGEFVNRKTYEVFVEHDPHGGDDLLKVRAIEFLPDSFSLTLGDALHNLRTALDYVMNEIEYMTCGRRTKFTKFPVYPTRASLEGAVNGGLKQKAPQQVLERIVDIIQPYKEGNGHGIWALNELDIEDKHRLLLAKTELSYITGICILDDNGAEIFPGTWQLKDRFIAGFPIHGSRSAKIKNQGQPAFKIVFADSLPLAGMEIIPTVQKLTELVGSVVDEVKYWSLLSQI